MSKVPTSIKMKADQRDVFRRAASLAHEDFTEFMVNSAMLRIERHLLEEKPQSPMAAFSKVHLEPYDASKVSVAVAKEIEDLIAKDSRGELEYVEMGKIKVRPPSGRG
jgi:Protein of unknown function (DUF1778)